MTPLGDRSHFKVKGTMTSVFLSILYYGSTRPLPKPAHISLPCVRASSTHTAHSRFLGLGDQHATVVYPQTPRQALSRNWRKISQRKDVRHEFQTFLWRFLQGKLHLFSVFRISTVLSREESMTMPARPVSTDRSVTCPRHKLQVSLFLLCRLGGSLKEVY